MTVPVALFYPLIFMYANIPGPDIGSAAFTAVAVFLLWRDILANREQKRTRRGLISAGVLLGLAALWRHHAVVSSVAIILFYSLTVRLGVNSAPARVGESGEKRGALREMVRGLYPLPAAFLLVCIIQIVVNIVSGHGAFETAQRFNVYKFVFDFDWWHPPTSIDMSMLDIILAQPVTFIKITCPCYSP